MQTHTNKLDETIGNVSAAMLQRSRDGYLTGRAKLGYVGRRTEYGMLPVPDPAAASLLREAFRLIAEGASLRCVTVWLRENGVKGKHGEPVSLATVQRVLTDPYYAGLVPNGEGGSRKVIHEAIVTPAEFTATQERLAAKRYCSPKT